MTTPVRMPAALYKPPLTRATVNVPSLNSLTPMQDRFIDEYLIDLDPRQAAIRSGVAVKDAGGRANAWMRHPMVRDAIGRAMAERSKRVGLNADRVLAKLGALVMGDPTSIFNEHGGLKLPSEMDEHDRLLIAGVKTRRSLAPGINAETGQQEMQPEEIVEIKVVDQVALLGMAMKHLGLMNEKLDINVSSLADRLREAQLRRAGVVLPGDAPREIEGEYEDVSEQRSLTIDGDGGSDQRDRLGQGSGELRNGHWHDEVPDDAGTAVAQSTTLLPPSAPPATLVEDLDYDPITGEALIDWDPLA